MVKSCPVKVIIAGGDPKLGSIENILKDVVKSGGASRIIDRSRS